jgi:hypothetical protein
MRDRQQAEWTSLTCSEDFMVDGKVILVVISLATRPLITKAVNSGYKCSLYA